ncbi:hypothetical protein CVT25_007966 [Psilocybe cyanescens]|uniref:Uncharacterized protein n=1 Tax=Psilocybe cyanescens TaxID=93625 RepID=A0A409XMU9_PSICY|nr:hypothetical protein CVT25_007966 [Psilocybe cyanescens]
MQRSKVSWDPFYLPPRTSQELSTRLAPVNIGDAPNRLVFFTQQKRQSSTTRVAKGALGAIYIMSARAVTSLGDESSASGGALRNHFILGV